MRLRINRRGHSLVAVALGGLALSALVACSSGSDDSAGAPDATDAPAPVSVTSDPATATPTDSTVTAEDTAGDDGGAECGGVTAAAVGEAVGAGDFDSADDISIDADTTCLFTNSMGVYGVSFSKEPISTYLAGELDGASTDDALSSLETLFAGSIDGPTTTRTDVDGNAVVVVTGTLLSGGPAGKAGAVVDGVAVVVEADGSELSADAAGFESIVTNVLALAVSSD
jgi:hypothetical protein